jgi:hypothetical protein
MLQRQHGAPKPGTEVLGPESSPDPRRDVRELRCALRLGEGVATWMLHDADVDPHAA